VNDHGDMAGGFSRSDGTVGAFFWRRGVSSDLGNLGGPNIFVSGLSEAGSVTGQADVSSAVDPRFGIVPYHAFLWNNGDLMDLGQIFGADFDTANGMNRAGEIVGAADLVGDVTAHAFSWNRGRIEDLGAQLSDPVSWATGVNDQGQAIGISGLVDDFPGDGPPSFTILCPCHAILWDHGVANVIDSSAGSDWTIDTPIAINDAGEIIAFAHSSTVPLQTVLLKPVAEDDGRAVSGKSNLSSGVAPTTTAMKGPRRMHRTNAGEYRIEY